MSYTFYGSPATSGGGGGGDVAAIFERHLNEDHNRAYDSFTRADNPNSLGMTETRGLTWGHGSGHTWGIINNTLYKSSAGYDVAVIATDQNGITSAKLAAFDPGDEFWIVARRGPSAAGFRLGKRSVNAAYTFENAATGADVGGALGTPPAAVAGDILRIISRDNDGLAAEITRDGVTTRYWDSGTTEYMSIANDLVGVAINGAGVRFDNFSFLEL